LNDVEGGGETEFPTLGINVTAKKGRALIWPSVIDSNPLVADGRTRHAALNVTKGLKFGANAWVHMGNFKDTYKKGCI
jgi:prolyl 4-hydroxylase